MNTQKKEYQAHVAQSAPKSTLRLDIFRAFVIGGLICVLGELLVEWYKSMSLTHDAASALTSVTLIGLSALMTGLGLYDKLAKYAGAGTLVPITGFANSVAAPCIEYQKEGQVFGIGVKVFTIAGPVILYGIFTSWVLGLIYWVWGMLR